MVEVVQALFCLVGQLADDVRVLEMALRAGKLLVGGGMPPDIHMVHAVARPAHQGAPRSVISADHDSHEDGADSDAGEKEFLGWQAVDIFPVHFQIPAECRMSHQMERLNVLIF